MNSLDQFDIPQNVFDKNETFKAMCRHCSSVISGSYRTTSNFVTHLKFQVSSRRHLSSKVIHEKARLISNTVKSQQKRAENICLTIDLWSNRSMKGFLGITAHYILDWEMKSAMIACKRFKGKHTAENNLHEYEDTISSFDINDKIFCVINDNASNMIKAFKCAVPGFSSPRQGSKDEECDDDDDDDDDESCEDSDSYHDSCHEREVVSSKASLLKNIESTFP
ncbi:uncharacterized protein LOC123533927 isoform X3 [Mercenaria mercenaria]|uniref:uncharacterized protein LOC123533927 isoform X3 n=1 Tax=Mercenaria mercenaria TaxID=6596 RepID=UPI00234EA864|nr:uncharacterized protein LOC123533927 isoform X3 [Mercenaria mercenaria]